MYTCMSLCINVYKIIISEILQTKRKHLKNRKDKRKSTSLERATSFGVHAKRTLQQMVETLGDVDIETGVTELQHDLLYAVEGPLLLLAIGGAIRIAISQPLYDRGRYSYSG